MDEIDLGLDQVYNMVDEDGRQLRREFQTVIQGTRRFESPEQVVQTYIAPLVHLVGEDALPSSLKVGLACLDSFSSSSSLATRKTGDLDVLLIEAVQESLLVRIVPDWTHSLDARQLHDLVHWWYFGPPSHDNLNDKGLSGLVQQCALRTISRLLTSSSAIHPMTLDRLKTLCVSGRLHISLPSLINAVLSGPNQARASVAWAETLRLLSSLPDRLANATQGQLPPTFSPRSWIETVFVQGISVTLNTANLSSAHLKLLKDVLARLEKLGYLSRAIDQDERGFWCFFLQASLQYAGAVQNWAGLRRRLGKSLRGRLDRALVETLQYLVVVRKGGVARLVAPQERGRAGSEGVAFLSKTSQEAVAAVAQMLTTLLPKQEADALNDSDSDSDSDSDIEGSSKLIRTLQATALSPIPQSPLLAWGWATYLSANLSPSSVVSCLKCTLDVWSEPTRISRSLIDEELYLATLIICLLSALPPDPSLTDQLSAISRSAAVLDGVSAHLSHADPTIRRLGMLTAELLSSKTPSPGGKVLNFGASIWNGVGEGREEARVLRALADAWAYHASAVDSITKGWGEARLIQALHVLGIQSAQDGHVDEMQSEESREVTVTTRKKASGGKSRRFPQRVEPPPRTKGDTSAAKARRPLITMIESDDDEDKVKAGDLTKEEHAGPLKMFSTTSTADGASALRHRRSSTSSCSSASSSSSSNGDDSDSDVAPDSSEHDIHKLAAELSGLSSTETQRILSKTPLASTATATSTSRSTRGSTAQRRNAPISDMEADREGHAPTFTKTAAAPVYMSQLSPMLKSSSRASIKLGLRHAAALIRRKSHLPTFGAEVAENAVDLSLTLVALHDKFGIRRFDEMRTAALIALAVAAPQDTVGVLTEQVFGSQYSSVQRIAMFRAIAESAVELAGVEAPGEGEGAGGVGERANRVAETVIRVAKGVGEEQVPAIRRQKQLELGQDMQHGQKAKRGTGLVVPLDVPKSRNGPDRLSKRQERERGREVWVDIAGRVYMYPLVQRYLAYHSHYTSLEASARFGAGTGGLFDASTLCLLLDLVTVLVSLSPVHLLPSLAHALFQVVANTLLVRASGGVDTASALNLLALLIHRLIESNTTSCLTHQPECRSLLRHLLVTVQQIFTSLQHHTFLSEADQPSVRSTILARAATVLLLFDQLDRLHQQTVANSLGFLPPT